MWKSSLMVELTPSGSLCLGWACAVSQSVLLLVDACWSCERSCHSRGADGLDVRSQIACHEAELERGNCVGRVKGKIESMLVAYWRFVNLRGFSRSISPSPLPLLVFIVREMMWIPTRCPWIESAVIPGFHSQVVVSSLPPCSLSLLRWGAETGAIPARSPVITKMGLFVPIAAQAAPLQFSLCRWS